MAHRVANLGEVVLQHLAFPNVKEAVILLYQVVDVLKYRRPLDVIVSGPTTLLPCSKSMCPPIFYGYHRRWLSRRRQDGAGRTLTLSVRNAADGDAKRRVVGHRRPQERYSVAVALVRMHLREGDARVIVDGHEPASFDRRGCDAFRA